MVYVFDSGSFGVLKHFYPSTFPSFWEQFHGLIEDGRLVSVREVHKELDRWTDPGHLENWIKENKSVFPGPTEEELGYVRDVFAVPHFQHLIGKKQMLKGYPVADPFVIARAWAMEACVISEEKPKPNSARIPIVCQHFGVECDNVQGLLSREGWRY